MERTLVVCKPDAVQRRLVGEIVSRFERKGLKMLAMKMLAVSTERAARMYAVHEGKEFYHRLMTFITSGPVVAMVLEGPDAIEAVRLMMGPTCGREAPGGTIRGDLGMARRLNLVHGSDSAESADYEIAVFFDDDELLDYQLDLDVWTYGD
ncbi:MAG: nucleoside-diphosphate kinase [Planctomycetota bacterium]|jgi:nucleoside-diphosphate kinase